MPGDPGGRRRQSAPREPRGGGITPPLSPKALVRPIPDLPQAPGEPWRPPPPVRPPSCLCFVRPVPPPWLPSLLSPPPHLLPGLPPRCAAPAPVRIRAFAGRPSAGERGGLCADCPRRARLIGRRGSSNSTFCPSFRRARRNAGLARRGRGARLWQAGRGSARGPRSRPWTSVARVRTGASRRVLLQCSRIPDPLAAAPCESARAARGGAGPAPDARVAQIGGRWRGDEGERGREGEAERKRELAGAFWLGMEAQLEELAMRAGGAMGGVRVKGGGGGGWRR